MSWQAVRYVIEHARVSRGSFTVLLILAEHAGPDGTGIEIGMTALGREARMTERHAYRLVASLEAEGWLAKEAGGGRGKANRYRIVGMGADEKDDIASGFRAETLTSATQNPDICAPPLASPYKDLTKEKPRERERERGGTDDLEERARAPTPLALIPVPDPWTFDAEDRAWVEERRMPVEWVGDHTGEFVDHFLSLEETAPVRNSLRGWKAKWRKWLSRDWREERTPSVASRRR